MNGMRGILRELVGLFVEDGSLTAFILIVVAGAAALALVFHAGPVAIGGFLLLGSLASLVRSVLRGAAKVAR
jgi:hypothetical protein